MKTIFEYRPSPIYALLKVMPLISLALLVLFAVSYGGSVLMAAALALTLVACYRYFYIWSVRYIVTMDTLQVTTGIWSKRTDNTELFRIKDYVISRPFWLRLFGLMHLTLATTDQTNNIINLKAIPYGDLPDVLQDLIRRARLNNHIIEIS
ncbi:PH domain-containing protein [Mucilaginibacter sp. UYCu711]|uniref:PH domain-containing protein n=1 Tax=Mucilaginibacter sp. UYCu711 TaxID=3156339 RepID=UPI003D22B35B